MQIDETWELLLHEKYWLNAWILMKSLNLWKTNIVAFLFVKLEKYDANSNKKDNTKQNFFQKKGSTIFSESQLSSMI